MKSAFKAGLRAWWADQQQGGWVYLVAAAVAVSAMLGLVSKILFPQPPTWAQFISVTAQYDPETNTLVIGRTRVMHEPCPDDEPLRREVVVYDIRRVPHVFWTEGILPPDNQPGLRTTLYPLVLPLQDASGRSLGIAPDLVRLTLHCGLRPPVSGDPVPVDRPRHRVQPGKPG